MLMQVPEWVTELRMTLRDIVREQAIGYGIPLSLVEDSKAVEEHIDGITHALEHLYINSSKKPDSCLGMNGIKFGEFRKRKKK